ncbi:tetratricopeptide repeat protein [Maricaulis sp.]|uniref:tetratricopeptide repeat protein n=1 Tax=Maricaulis sp. TaxID=1486257 RepID=UPI0025C33399|nr:tetratricopeptide repeat protein [Maricaulis sp.]
MQDATVLDLDAEISAEAEIEKNETRDAVLLGTQAVRVDTHLDRLPPGRRKTFQKVAALAKRAMKTSAEGDNVAAARLAHRAWLLAPDMALTNHVLGLMLYNLGRLSRALDFFEAAWKIDPKDAEIYQKLGLVAWKLDMLDAAEKFYRLQYRLAPTAVDAAINLGGVLRDAGKFEEAIEILRTAIYAHQDNYELWNSMGTVINDSGDPIQARTFYEEALRLKPDYGRAHNNMANIHELLGEPALAIPHFDAALKDPADAMEEATMRHGRSMVLLAAGRIEEGWAANESRLNPNRAQATLFTMKAPMWDGTRPEQLRGKTLLLVGEQGLGDEVIFMNIVKDLLDAVGSGGELRIACEYRLMPLVKRSFPQAVVGHHMSANVEGRDVRVVPRLEDGADFWTPMATPLRSFRNSLDAYPTDAGFLVPDPALKSGFRAQIDGFGSGLKVGILWKSLNMNARRSRFFSAFDAWEGVLKTPGVDFINLQYGKVEDELALARERFGVTLHQPTEIDLKMDLDKVAAYASSCDLVLGPMNATSNLAAACGGKVWFIHARSSTWTLLGTDRQYWYPQTRSFFGSGFRDWDNTMKRVAEELAALATSRG